MSDMIKYRKVNDSYYEYLERVVPDAFNSQISVTTMGWEKMIDKQAALADLAEQQADLARRVAELVAL